jgi:uncharacterized protein YqhQ
VPTEKPAGRVYIGGQAVIEGVMMRAPEGLSVAVRRPDGTLSVLEGALPSEHGGLRKIPGIRGILMLVESMTVGYRALTFSAEQQELGASGVVNGAIRTLHALVVAAATGDGDEDPFGRPRTPPKRESNAAAKGAMVLSTLFALGLFIALPQLLAAGLLRLLGLDYGPTDWQFHALTGTFKLAVLTTYLVAISRIEEVRRVFHYHGAEHKTIYAYEAELPLTVANVRAQSRLHPRCGTTFLITVVVISVILGSIVTPFVLPNAEGFLGQIETLALRIALLPFVAAISYELQRLSARYCTTGPLRVLLYPGFLFQKITTREPDDSQIEVAIVAMESARSKDKNEGVRAFPSFDGALAHYRSAAAA